MFVFYGPNRPEKSHIWVVSYVVAVIIFACVISSGAYAQDGTNVEGEIVKDVWTWEGSPYYVTGPIRVIGELVINPGVVVDFLGNYGIEVVQNAVLTAKGIDNVGGRILFTSKTLMWSGISFMNSSSSCRIANCDFINASTAINCFQSDVSIDSNRIEANSIAINCNRSSPIILNNYHIGVIGLGNGGSNFIAISIQDQSSPVIQGNHRIECSVTENNTATGIYIRDSNPCIVENWIEVVSNNETRGIHSDYVNGFDIIRNIIRVRSAVVTRGLEFYRTTGVRAYSNDVIIIGTPRGNGSVGIRVDHGSYVEIINNIVTGDGSSTGLWSSNLGISRNSGYNLYYRHDTVYRGLLPLEGDLEDNPLFEFDDEDPDFADYHLTEQSPCINRGFPDWRDPDGSRSDIGRYWYYFVDEESDLNPPSPSRFEILASYPNPFNSVHNLSFNLLSSGYVVLSLYDNHGRMARELWSGHLSSGRHILNWQAEGLSAGNYIIRLETADRALSKQVIYLP